ncbi:MAG TPA: TetR/AcrR family transcriptional regulator [Thermoplasmata archaeon]|nr:TetR/AcrR family transcriptional regulator [Thermoplasmata archaeon]
MPRSASANRAIQERQRANLLMAAQRVFFREGSVGTMAELAREAGVSQGLAYRYFPSKTAIFRALIAEFVSDAEPVGVRLRRLPGGPRARLEAIVRGILERRRQGPEFFRFLLRALRTGDLPASVRRRLRARFREIRRQIRVLIVAGQRQGEIAPDDPDELATALLAALEGLWRRSARVGDASANDKIPRAEVLLRMLGSPPPSASVASSRRVGASRTTGARRRGVRRRAREGVR